MGGHAQLALVRPGNDRPIDFGTHFLGGAEIVVDANLDPIRLQVRRRVDRCARLFWRFRGDDRSGDIKPAAVERRVVIVIAEAETSFTIVSQAHDRGHAVARVETDLTSQVLFVVALRCVRESTVEPT